jgi:hypothetical protein
MNDKKTYRVGILGCANIAVRSLIPAFHNNPRYEVYAIASRKTEKATFVAEKYSCKAYGNYDELLHDKEVDVVYMPLPTGMHCEWGKKILMAGKHLLSEKSLACSYGQVKELVDIARNNGLLIMENFQFRFHTQTQWVREQIASGKLGEIRCFRSSFGFPPFKDANNIRYVKSLGGGALLDAGAYTVKSMNVIFPKENFKYKSSTMITPAGSEVDLYGGAYFESESGIIAELAFGFDNYYQCGFEIWGSKGKLTSTRAYTAPATLSPKIIIETSEDGRVEIELPPCDHFNAMLDHFAECIDKGMYEGEYQQNLMQARFLNEIKVNE